MARHRTEAVDVGGILIGGANPVAVQSMTNTDTADVGATARQVRELAEAGSELVRITVNTPQAARAVPEIVQRVEDSGPPIPIVGDFHYNGHILLRDFPGAARKLAKYRINPGNVGLGSQHDRNFETIVAIARDNGKAIRIGVNWGSLDQSLLTRLMDENQRRKPPLDADEVLLEAMVQSATESAELAEATGLPANRIILSAKVSGVTNLVGIYRTLAERTTCPLHLGLTEAGMGRRGTVRSAAALSILLADGIGDTIRVSITPSPGGDRTEEVRVAWDVLQSLGLRSFSPEVSACPGCGRTTSTLFQDLAAEIDRHLERRMKEWKASHPGVETLKVAVMGCIVNGPGESRHADVGISLPGTGEEPKAPVYVDGKLFGTLQGPEIVNDFMKILEEYVHTRFADPHR